MSSSVFEQLQKEAKDLAAEGRLLESLEKFEQARKIKETPKILQRIQKLKDFIGENAQELRRSSANEVQKSRSSREEEKKHSSRNSPGVKVLNQIQNTEIHDRQPLKKLSESHPPFEKLQSNPPMPEGLALERFNQLKKEGMELSYVGNFEDSLELFSKALEIYPCPKVKKFYEEIKLMASQHPEELHKVQALTSSVKKLVKEGNHVESLKSLKDAYAVCPSPSISSMIKKLETPNHLKDSFKPSDSFRAKKLFNESRYSQDVTPEISKQLPKAVFAFPKPVDPLPTEKFSTGSKDSKDTTSTSSLPNDVSALSPQRLARFKHLYQKAREDAGEGKLEASLKALLEAKSICATDKILKRINDLQKHIKELEESGDEGNEMMEVADGFFLFHEVYKKMYPYQRQGVAWMWKLFQKRKGGILGDDMGLGKTFQVIAFLSGLIDAEKVKHVLIIMPVSLLPNWEKEFKKWCPGIVVNTFHTGTKREKERKILRIQRKGHVLLTSYGMTLSNQDYLAKCEGRDFIWDYVILDEGHKIKNPTKTTKAVYEIPSRNRLVLSGTPIQNNLSELWALFDFVHQGTLLGSRKTFKITYENTITRAREKDATAGEKRLGTEMADNLKKLISPYFLRRTKAEVFDVVKNSGLETDIQNLSIQGHKLAKKNDLIMWVYLSDIQCEIYRNFLHSDAVKTILLSKRSPLVELTILKKICDHPRLLSHRACLQLGLNGQLSEEDLLKELEDESSYSASISNVSDETLIAESGKMKFLINLLEELKSNGHRTLVFSLSRKILDMVHRILVNRNWKVLRIDGTISKMDERERRIQLFQKDPSYYVFLLTTQVGGVGITLTAADRVVIYDPSWNPATDAQAVDRVYRIGQQKNVVVYRLITCGSVEEKIYRRQVFKDSITRQATGAADPYRYFSKQELRELFTLDNPHHSGTQVQLHQMHSGERHSSQELDHHIAFIHSLNVFGISDHDLMFSKNNTVDQAEDNDQAAVSHNYIKQQVTMAQARIQDEAAVVEEGISMSGCYARPYPSLVQTFRKNSAKDAYVPPTFPEAPTNTAMGVSPQYQLGENAKRSPLTSNSLGTPVEMVEKVKNWLSQNKNGLKQTFFGKSANSEEETHSSASRKSNVDHEISIISIHDSMDESDHHSLEKNSLEQPMECSNSPNQDEKEEREHEEHNSPLKSERSVDEARAAEAATNSPSEERTSNSCASNEESREEKSEIEMLTPPDENDSSVRNTQDSKSESEMLNPSDENNTSVRNMQDSKSESEMLNPSDEKNTSVRNMQDSKSESEMLNPSDESDTSVRNTQDSKSESEMLNPFEENDSSVRNSQDLKSELLSEEPKSFTQDDFLTDDLDKNSDSKASESSGREDSPSQSNVAAKVASDGTSAFTDYRSVESNAANTSSDLDSLFGDVLPASTPLKKIPSPLSGANSLLMQDLSFDEQPVAMRKSMRKSCAKKLDVDFDSDSESLIPSAEQSEDEIVPESDNEDRRDPETDDEAILDSDQEIVQDSLDESNLSGFKSVVLDSSSVVPNSIPNSPSVSRRITALKLRKSTVPPVNSSFAKALALSPLIDVDKFSRLDETSTSVEMDSPIVLHKRKNAVLSESEED